MDSLQLQKNKLLIYPCVFGVLGVFIGLFLRYIYAGGDSFGFAMKNILHSHSHVMLLGCLLNYLYAILWIHFTPKMDRISYVIYLVLQGIVSVLLIGFALQGYAFFTILFSTLHLWLSYIFLIRLWKNLEQNNKTHTLVKIGIVFHFIASIGPYALAPLKINGLEYSEWYQQAIFFYLHFQYFGSFFIWLLAVFVQQTRINISTKEINFIVVALILLYCHSLDFSFDSVLINIFGGIGSVVLFGIFFQFRKKIKDIKYKLFYLVLSTILFLNIFGSVPFFSDLVANDHFLLIAWLHLLFLGIYLPFMWLQLPIKIKSSLWLSYAAAVSLTELLLCFPNYFSEVSDVSIMKLLFLAYLPVVICISIVHLTFLFETTKK